ncbi:MAG: hypothetical protein ACKO68_07715 [Bacteroidota bacterium]
MNSKGFRFIPWLISFFVALVAIPCLIYLNQFLVAKILGITVTVTLVVVLRIWLHQLKKRGSAERYSLTSNDIFELHSLVPAFKELPTSDQLALQHRIGLIMGTLLIHNPDDLPVELSPKNLAICGSFYAFMNLQSPREVVWFIRQKAQRSVDSKYFYLGAEELRDYLKNLSAEELQSRLSA